MYLDQLFDEISQLPRDERDAAITGRCQGWPVIEREVRALLAAFDDDVTEGHAVLDVAEGTVLGHFQLVERLGRGATASVWRAFDTKLQAYTALKLLDPGGGLRGKQALNAVLLEARAASSIISDHVIRIKTAGRFAGGLHYVEMELCAERSPAADGTELLAIGRSLEEVPLTSIEEKVRVVAEAARGVDAAHRVGVLHRDLKPGNILLTPVSRRAKVVDFGLAAEQLYPAPGPAVPSHRTVTVLLEASDGKVVGTPAYMPPEQAYGHPPTRTTDVYALGATLYALLVDDHPYVPSHDAAVPALDVLSQVRQGPPRPLGSVTPVPRRLERMVRKAMARSARDRYATAGALADDLEAWLAGTPAAVDGRAPLLHLGLFVARHRTLVATVAVGACVLLAFAGALGWMELQRRGLEARIARSRVELVVSQGMAQLADAARQRAQVAAEESEAAWRRALRGESNAEQRWRTELFARQEAERLRLQERQARELAEASLATSTEDLEALSGELETRAASLAALETTLAAAVSDLQAARSEVAERTRERDAESVARVSAEAAERTAVQRLEQLEREVERLTAAVAVEASARHEAERALQEAYSETGTATDGELSPR